MAAMVMVMVTVTATRTRRCWSWGGVTDPDGVVAVSGNCSVPRAPMVCCRSMGGTTTTAMMVTKTATVMVTAVRIPTHMLVLLPTPLRFAGAAVRAANLAAKLQREQGGGNSRHADQSLRQCR